MRGHQRLDLEGVEAARAGRLSLGVGVREVVQEGEELQVVGVDVGEGAVVEQGGNGAGEQPPPRVAVVGGPDAPSVEGQESRMRNLIEIIMYRVCTM